MASSRGAGGHDHVALDEIEMCGDLIIAASTSGEDRLAPDLIDEVLKVRYSGDPESLRVPVPRSR